MKQMRFLAIALFVLVPIILISGCTQGTSIGKDAAAADNGSVEPNATTYIKKAPAERLCEPLKNKNKVAVVIAKNGIYDTEEAHSQVLKYYGSVKKDLNLENAGLQKFDGETMDDFEGFIDSLYLDSDVGYIILLGDGLPVTNFPIKPATEEFAQSYDQATCYAISERLEYVNKSKRECTPRGECIENCKDLAISLIVAPDLYSDGEKANFTLKILETYTDYHDNFAARIAGYQESVLVIYDSSIYTDDKSSGYGLPSVLVNNMDAGRIADELKGKHQMVVLLVHGSADSIGMGIGNFGTTQQEYSNFVKENGLPFLFVDTTACQSTALKMENATHCCWPQAFMESGVWADYQISPNNHELRKDFPNGEPLGLALRKYPVKHNFIFGDILAHMKGKSQPD